MCGILFIRDQKLNLVKAKEGLSTLDHRGPDNTGVLIKEDLFIGHKRLSIIDLSKSGNQPMTFANGKLTIIHNGEIYNYNELKGPLKKKSYFFNSRTDTELIMSGYMNEGISFFKKLRGMYAFIIIDQRNNKNKLISVRDTFGIKPLYIYHQNDIILMASEMKAILSYLGGNQLIDEIMLLHYLMQGYCSEPRTIYKNIRAQEPGKVEVFDLLKNTHQVVDLDIINWEIKPKYFDPLELEFFLKQAIQRNLVSDVPVKVGLSSGIDSSIIFALADKDAYDTGLTVRMKNPNFDESNIALKYADILGKKTELVEIDNSLNMEAIDDLLLHFDQPFGDSSLIPTFLLSNACKQVSSVVLLGGDGGDEQFYGYYSMHLLHKIHSLSATKRIFHLVSGLFSTILRDRRITKLHLISGKLNESFYFRNAWILPDALSENIKYKSLIKSIGYKWDINREKSYNLDSLIINQFMRTTLLSDYLRKIDMMSMYNGVEYRVPFLDEDLVNYSLTIPKRKKFMKRIGKIPLRSLHRKYYNGFGSQLSKKGFSIPYNEYLTSLEKRKMNSIVKKFMKGIGSNYLDSEYINNLCNSFKNIGKVTNGIEHSMLQRYFIIYAAAKQLPY